LSIRSLDSLLIAASKPFLTATSPLAST